LFTDFPEKFAERRRLFALGKNGERREMKVEDHWPHKGWMVLKFAGVDSIEAAELLIGCELQIPLSERAKLSGGATYVSDLIGCVVFDFAADGPPLEVGTIKDVEFGTGEAPTLIVAGKTAADEIMIPFAEPFVRKLDVAAKRLDMTLPDGLLEVHKPLKDEKPRTEKRRRS
jgi:16S rRNA processing protein RimM